MPSEPNAWNAETVAQLMRDMGFDPTDWRDLSGFAARVPTTHQTVHNWLKGVKPMRIYAERLGKLRAAADRRIAKAASK